MSREYLVKFGVPVAVLLILVALQKIGLMGWLLNMIVAGIVPR